MSQLNVKLDERRLKALRHFAVRRRTPVSWLIRDYIDHLLAGGRPVAPASDELASIELTRVLARAGTFDWLADEPDLYTWDDGEPA